MAVMPTWGLMGSSLLLGVLNPPLGVTLFGLSIARFWFAAGGP
jgi:hypothetical protein